MQFKLVAALAATAMAASTPSLCDKYTTALLKTNTGANQLTLLSLLVNTAVIGNFTGAGTKNPTLPGSMVNVPGILAPAGGLLPYFDGSLASTNLGGSTGGVQNFLDGGGAAYIIANPTMGGMAGSAQATLLTHLYQYFGLLLGCTAMGFPSYAGVTSMTTVHKFMDLDETQFTYFVSQVGAAAESFGVTSADVTTVATALNSTFGMRCAAAASIPPTAPKALQAICEASSCPEAASPDCAAYASVSPPTSASASASGSASPAPTPVYSSAAASQISDGQPQVTSPGAVVSQISDGQPQVTSPAPAYTGAAGSNAAPAALAGLAGIAALVL